MENPGVYIHEEIPYTGYSTGHWPFYWPLATGHSTGHSCVTYITKDIIRNGNGCACNMMSFLKNFVLKVILRYMMIKKNEKMENRRVSII